MVFTLTLWFRSDETRHLCLSIQWRVGGLAVFHAFDRWGKYTLPGDNATTSLPVVYFNYYLTPDVTYC